MRYTTVLLILGFLGGSVLQAEPIKPLPLKVAYDSKKAALGKKLFYDPILSRDNSIACVDCHDLQHGGDDGRTVSRGIEGREGMANALTVYNSRYNFRHFWDGRAKGLKAQVFMSIGNPKEMDQGVEETLAKLRADRTYREWFADLYADGVTRSTVEDAISEFEKALVTPNAPFDKYLRGDTGAIGQKAKEGYGLFKSKGCILCHNGINIGGNFYNKFGIYREVESSNPGRYALTHHDEDYMLFRVPSLRNVALTAPYMHDGRARSLKEAVEIMSKHQLGREMSPEEIGGIVSFLNTLTGEIPDIAGKR